MASLPIGIVCAMMVMMMMMMMMTATKATVVNATTVVSSVTAIDDPIMQNQQPSRRILRPWEENEQEQEQFTMHQEEQQQQQIIEVETEPEIVTEIEPEQPEPQRGDCEDVLSYIYNNNHKQSCDGKWLRRSSSMSSHKIKKIQKRCRYVDSDYDSNHQEATVADYCPSICKEECRAGLDFDYSVVLESNQKLTESNVYTSSPNKKYMVGIQDLNSEDNEGGKLVILKKRKRRHKEKPPKVVWSVLQKYTLYDDVTNITSVSMQRDGNLVARNNATTGNVVWKTSTHHFPGSTLNIDNNGQLFILYRHDYQVENEEEDLEFVPVYNEEQEIVDIDTEIEDDEEDGIPIRRRTLMNSSTNHTKVLETKVWIDGLPPKQTDSTTNTASITNLEFPVRGIFYYPWFPATWKVGNGSVVFYEPNLLQLQGKYKSSDPRIVENHIQALKYGNMDVGIISWWGQGEHNDKAKIQQLLDETKKQQQHPEQESVSSTNKVLKWTVYYEDEYKLDKSVDDLVAELNYLHDWYAWQHEVWAYKDNKPVIFVWNEPHECEVMDRWVEAGKIAGWYVVLKLFSDHDTICDAQPDSWHQYGVSPSGPIDNREWSYTIGPGFWHAKEPEKPRVPRASQTTFCDWVTTMQSRINTDWHLIVSFNEWGEGTSVESATAWESDSGYGIYLDCLHDPIKYGGSSVGNVDNNNKNYNDIMTGDNMDLQEYINSRLKLGEK